MRRLTGSLMDWILAFWEWMLPLAQNYWESSRPLRIEARQALQVILDRVTSSRWSMLRWMALTLAAAMLWASLAALYGRTRPETPIHIDPLLGKAQLEYVACKYRWAISSDPNKYAPAQQCYRYKIARSFNQQPLLFEMPFRMLFTPSVFRMVLVAMYAFWLVWKLASQVLARAYNLPEVLHRNEVPWSGSMVAEHHLLQNALINRSNTVTFQDGKVLQADRDLPVFLIGGPGSARINLENAVLYERSDGEPVVRGPTLNRRVPVFLYVRIGVGLLVVFFLISRIFGGLIGLASFLAAGTGVLLVWPVIHDMIVKSVQRVSLGSFERQRSVIDLRDQHASFPVTGRTQDGILIEVQDVKAIFSVQRPEGVQATLETPYPYVPDAIERLVYNQGSGPWQAAMSSSIRGFFLDFFARHSLNEFLAMIDTPEWDTMDAQEQELQDTGVRLAETVTDEDVIRPQVGRVNNGYVPRSELSQRLYNAFEERGAQRGVQLSWAGVGTWGGMVETIVRQHEEAWQITRQNQGRRGPGALNGVQRESRLVEVMRLLQTVALGSYRRLQENNTLTFGDLRESINAYHDALLEAYRHAFPYLQHELERRLANAQQERHTLQDVQALIRDEDTEDDEARQQRVDELARLQERIDASEREEAEIVHLQERLERERRTVESVLRFLARFAGRWAGDPGA